MPQFGNFDPSNGAGQPLHGVAPASGSYLSDRASEREKILVRSTRIFFPAFPRQQRKAVSKHHIREFDKNVKE